MIKPNVILQVNVYPTGSPGEVAVEVLDVGRVPITAREAVLILGDAIRAVEDGISFTRKDPTDDE